MLVEIGGNHVNPAQVIRVTTVADDEGDPHTVVHLSDGYKVMTSVVVEKIVALINANL